MSNKRKRMRNSTYVAGFKKGIEVGKGVTFEALKEVLFEDLFKQKGIGEVTQRKIGDAIERMPRVIKMKESDFNE